MSFTPESQTPGSGLEDRLRGLILNNSQPVAASQYVSQPNMQSNLSLPQSNQQSMATPPSSSPVDQLLPGGRKRPNQAQRRQMSSQLSIPVDSRPAIQGTQSGRGFSPSTGGWNSATGFASPRHYGPQSAPLSQGRPQQYQYSPRFQNHSPASPYPSQMQFQQSSPLSPMQQMHVQPHAQQGYRHHNGPQSAGLMDPNQWRGSEQQHGRLQNGGRYNSRPPPQSPQLYQSGPYNGHRSSAPYGVHPEQLSKQSSYLQTLLDERVPLVGIDEAEIAEKDQFRSVVEQLCRDAISKFEREENNPDFNPASVQLACFGSMASGFATKASDMDLALLSPQSKPAPDSSESSIPRILEKCLLEAGYGARLLTRTRVPIIKLCQRPTVRLMSDLLEERAKWENGFVAEGAEGNGTAALETIADEEDPETQNDSHIIDILKESSGRSPEEVYQEQLKSLRQKTNQSLGDYYGSAKRLLRKIGSRDIISGSATHTENEINILEDVCRAFVNGLTDTALRDRLSTYRSLIFTKTDAPHLARSLSGVYSQIEGENLAMRWETRPLTEASASQETMWGQEIAKWQTLLNQTQFETSQYNRTIHNALDRLRKIPSLQLHFLEQGQHEDAGQYYLRTRKLLVELGVNNVPHVENHKLSIIVSHYLSGVRDPKARETLELISYGNPIASLDSIALHHRTLQLADDYEAALSKKLYSDKDQEDIKQYIVILREGVMNFTKQLQVSPPPTSKVLPLTPAMTALITRLQSLPDPSQAHKPRDRYSDHLEFRNEDNIGIQCDINFSAQLALHNTSLLRCYSLTDTRVKPLILFVKHWAKLRGINTPYRGTLSSYGYVLMVLHYLTNIASPFVCPNLQLLRRPIPDNLPPAEIEAQTTCSGCDVQFWRNEKEIANLAERAMLNHNKDSIGTLLRGFFEYYAFNGQLSTGNGVGFDWMRDVLSLRTEGGLLTKQEKGWVGARTVIETTTEAAPAALSVPIPSPSAIDVSLSNVAGPKSANQTPAQTPTTPAPPKKLVVKEETKEIRHRYLFAIEDPFELDHNVARTVTHNGIVAVRDEFRRAWRIIKSVGHQGSRSQQQGPQEHLLEEVLDQEAKKAGLKDLMEEIHGLAVVGEAGDTEGVLVN